MPTYRYRCDACGDELEVWQSIKDDSLTDHDPCGGRLVKVLSPAGIVLKGSGFYKTDSRKGASGNGKDTPATPSKETAAKPAGSSDSKPSESGGSTSSGSGGAKDSSSSGSSSSGSGTSSGTST